MQRLLTIFAAVAPPGNIPQVTVDNGLVTNVFNVVLGLAGALAVAFIVLGGIQYIISQGDSSKITAAKNTLLYAIVGLVIVTFSFAILNFVLGKF